MFRAVFSPIIRSTTVFTVSGSVHEFVHRDTYHENNQQDALYRLIYYSKSALYVSGAVFAHHQEHLTVFTVSGSVHEFVHRDTYHENNQQDALYRLIYFSKSALLVSGGVFAHHQEHFTVFTVSGSVHSSCCRLVSRK